MDYSLTDSSVHGISQARILEWVPSPGDLPGGLNPWLLPCKQSPAWQADALTLN